jgi:hypothetical protein
VVAWLSGRVLTKSVEIDYIIYHEAFVLLSGRESRGDWTVKWSRGTNFRFPANTSQVASLLLRNIVVQ